VGANKLVSILLSDAAFSIAGTSFEGLAVITATGSPVIASVYSPHSGGGVTFYNCLKLQ
jgi:hypothetical protein